MKDELGDRMKLYEQAEAGRRLMPRLPVCARLDGKRFSRFTRGLARPYHERLSRLMISTTTYLVRETSALVGYSQSDEISLLWFEAEPRAQAFLDRKVQKLTSILASMVTAYFNQQLQSAIPERAGALALFDARVWNVPDLEEAANVFLWRELDATKNSVGMAARAFHPHEALVDRSQAELHEMLHQQGVNWNDYPAFFKRGTFVLPGTTTRGFSVDKLDALPPRHAARRDPDLVVTRREVRAVEMPPLRRVVNRVGALFHGEEPEVDGSRGPA